MADTKISALTAASTPLAGTEVLPIVQSGTTVKVAVSNLTAGRAVAAKSITGDALTDATVAAWNSNNGTYGLDIGYSYNNSRIGSAGSAKGIDGTRALTDFGLHGINNLEFFTGYTYRGKWDSNGNFVIGAANKGINFTANTPATGMTSQLLNWYEDGTFTPTIVGTSSAGTGTYSSQVGVYTRIGKRVFFNLLVNWSAHTGTGSLRIGGLPFTSLSTGDAVSPISVLCDNITLTANNTITGWVPTNSTQVAMYQMPVGGGAFSSVAMDTSGMISVSGSYSV